MGQKQPLPPGVVAVVKVGKRRFPVYRKKRESKAAAVQRVLSKHVGSTEAKGDEAVVSEGSGLPKPLAGD